MSLPATMSIGTVNIRKLDMFLLNTQTRLLLPGIYSAFHQKIHKKQEEKTHPFEQSRYRKENKNLMFEFTFLIKYFDVVLKRFYKSQQN